MKCEIRPRMPPIRTSNPPIPPPMKPTMINTIAQSSSPARFEPNTATMPRIRLIMPTPKKPAIGDWNGRAMEYLISARRLKMIMRIPPIMARM